MCELNSSLLKVMQDLQLAYKVAVQSDYESTAISVGYQFPDDLPHPAVFVQFGLGSAVLTITEFQAVLAHEFAHIKLGHTKQTIFRCVYWLIKHRKIIGVQPALDLLVSLTGIWKLIVGRKQEFEADRIAKEVVGAEHIGRFLVRGAAFDVALENIFDANMHKDFFPEVDAKRLHGMSLVELATFIAEMFRSNRDWFCFCSQRAKTADCGTMSYPSTTERLNRLELSWDELEKSCFQPNEQIIDFSDFRRWLDDSHSNLIDPPSAAANKAMQRSGGGDVSGTAESTPAAR
jgi:Zn-dependent protease with chaperone function